MQQYRLPTIREKVELQGLISAPDLNGRHGIVVRYEKDVHRYRIQLLLISSVENDNNNNKQRQLAIKPENILLLSNNNEQLNNNNNNKQEDWNNRSLMHVFIPCHIGDKRRLEQFRQCTRSVMVQTAFRCRVFVGVSSSNSSSGDDDDDELRLQAMTILRTAAAAAATQHHLQWYVYEEKEKVKKSQFQHFQSLLPISMHLNPDAWLMFLDNDDLFHPIRVEFFQTSIETISQRHDDVPVDAFCCGGKLLIDDEMTKEKFGHGGDEQVLKLEQFLEYDRALDGLVTVAASEEENSEMDVTEYFDFCVRTSVLHRYLQLTPDEILSHVFCDVRFLASISRLLVRCFEHPEQEWLLIHYRVRQSDRNQAFQNADTEKYKNHAMMTVDILEFDQALSEEMGGSMSVEKISFMRKDIEEAAIQMIERDDENLEYMRRLRVPDLDEKYGHSIGSRL